MIETDRQTDRQRQTGRERERESVIATYPEDMLQDHVTI